MTMPCDTGTNFPYRKFSYFKLNIALFPTHITWFDSRDPSNRHIKAIILQNPRDPEQCVKICHNSRTITHNHAHENC